MIIVRSYDEAVDWVIEKGCPIFISFDNDLGDGPTGYDFSKWLVNCDIEHNIIPTDFTFDVHSQNPIGKQNIDGYLNQYLKYRNGL